MVSIAWLGINVDIVIGIKGKIEPGRAFSTRNYQPLSGSILVSLQSRDQVVGTGLHRDIRCGIRRRVNLS